MCAEICAQCGEVCVPYLVQGPGVTKASAAGQARLHPLCVESLQGR